MPPSNAVEQIRAIPDIWIYLYVRSGEIDLLSSIRIYVCINPNATSTDTLLNLGISLFMDFDQPTNPSFFMVERRGVLRVDTILNHITLYRSDKPWGQLLVRV